MEQNVSKLITKSALNHKRIMTKLLERFDITYAQYQVLRIVKAHQPITAKEMLVYLDTDKATLSGILNRLEKRDLVIRAEDKRDRRLMYVQLTKKSAEMLEDLEELEESTVEMLLDGVKNREYKNFLNAFETMLANQKNKLEELEKEEE